MLRHNLIVTLNQAVTDPNPETDVIIDTQGQEVQIEPNGNEQPTPEQEVPQAVNDESRQLLKPNVVDTTAFSQLPPKHKEVVNDFFNQVDYDNIDVVKEVETTIDKGS